MTTTSAATHPGIGWARRASPRAGLLRTLPVVRFLADFASHVVFWLAVWALGPTLFGWQTVALVSGSMSPSVNAGDIVVAEPYTGATLAPGTVIVFHAPGSGRLTTHRIVGVHGDGSYRTKGDANATPDSTPVAPADVVAVGRLRVPLIGLAIAWWEERNYGLLIIAAVALALAGALRTRGAPLVETRASPGGRRFTRRRVATASVSVVAAVVILTHLTAAAFAGTTANSGNAWASTTCTPGSATLSTANGSAVQDTYVDGNNPAKNYATVNAIFVRGSGPVQRSLVQFSPLPTIPAGCAFKTATLSLNVLTKPTSSVTYDVFNIAMPWTATSVTWNAQPATSGSPVSVTQPSATGLVSWDVSALVAAQIANASIANGFLIKDQLEASSVSTKYSSNEDGTATRRPALTVTWGW